MSVSTILTSKRTISAIACSLSLAAMAATPVAVWDGDFGTSEKIGTDGKTYALTLPSGADSWVQGDGTLKIGSGNQSAYINLQVGSDYNLAQGTKISVLMEYTNAVAQTGAAPIYLQADAYFGLKTKDSSLDVVGDYWGVTYPTTGGVVTTMPSDGCILMVYPQGGGAVQVYSATTRTGLSDASAGGDITGLAFSNKYLQKIGIGGTFTDGSAKNLKNFENLVIKKVAVFTSAITATDAAAYYFPSEIQTINVDSATTVSAINAQFDSANYKVADVTVASNVTITVDEAFNAKIQSVSSTGSITLSANTQPDSSYFANVDFSGVQGGLLRSWLTPGVVGFNFNANGGRNGQGNTDGAADTALALEIGTWYKDAYSPSGSSTAMFADGLSLLTWQANNVYAEANGLTAGTFIQGYLDDGNNVDITLSNVPYATYDVIIYCSTDNPIKSFKAKTVNGTVYKWDSATGQTVVAGGVNETWGLASAAAGKAVYGANTLRINGLSGPLSIIGGTNSDNARGCISAIQIMPAGTSTAPEMTVGTAGQTTQATWTGASWNVENAPTSGNVIINTAGDVELTIDETVDLSAITVTGEGSLKIIPDQQNNVTFTASSISISPAIPLFFANDGIGIDTVPVPVTYLYKPTSINSSMYGNTYTAGAGSQGTSVVINHNGGSAVLDGTVGDTYYLAASHNATATTVVFTNATATYSTSLGVGAASYVVAGQSTITTGVNSDNPQSFVLSQGGDNRTSSFLLKDTSTVTVTGTSDVDSNQASIMFGHWNGPSTFTIQDSAAFNAVCQVLVGKTRNNHMININGGTFTAKGIKASASATGTNTLNLNGGLLVLGASGITSYGSTTIGVNVNANSEIRASDTTLPISQSVAISENATLSFTKSSGVAETVVTLTGAVSGVGAISVGSGVTLALGSNRPENEISFDENGSLSVVMLNKADQPVFKVASAPSAVILYDTDGTTMLDDTATFVYDDEAGTITIKPPIPQWTTVSDSGSFDTAANWSTGSVPTSGDALIVLSQDTSISISGTYELSSLTISGAGKATLAGTGSITVDNVYILGGTALAHGGQIIATSVAASANATLILDAGKGTLTESAVISGAGAVETYGNVTMATNNTYTGGTTVKTGKLSSTMPWGYGPFTPDMACSAQSCVTVEDGACVSLDNIINVANAYRLVIAGKGLVRQDGTYSGAVVYTQGACDSTSRQISSITLASDALVDLGNGWGLVHHSYGTANLALAGHTLTVRGAGSSVFPMQNVTALSSGTIVVENATLQLAANRYGRVSNLTNVNIVAKGATSIDFTSTATAIGSLTLKPSASGTTASGWNLPSGFVPAVDTSNIDAANLTVGQELTLFTAPSATELTAETISVAAGGRYTVEISGNTVTATVNALAPFLHYDFNGEATLAGAKASDSVYEIPSYGNYWPSKIVAKNGYAALINSGHVPWWNENSANVSPLHAGEMSVLALIRPKTIDSTVRTVWNLGSALENGIALVVKDSSTLALVGWTNGGSGFDIAVVSGIERLEGKWHFVAIVTSENGTLLYVDDMVAFSETVVPQGIAQEGQFGSVHSNGKSKGYYGQNDAGFLLDDWRVYDAALTAKEVKALKRELNPDPLFIRLR